LIVFNSWYYSFSPTVAGLIASHEIVKQVMRVILYPLIAILRVSSLAFDAFDRNHELASVVAGLLASVMIGGVYLGLPMGLLGMLVFRQRKAKVLNISRRCNTALGLALITSAVLLPLGEVFRITEVLMLSTTTLVLAATCLSATFAASTMATRVNLGSKTGSCS